MGRNFTIPLILLATQPAFAHVSGGPGDILMPLVHQLVGTHHLPFTLALIAVGVLVVRGWRARKSGR